MTFLCTWIIHTMLTYLKMTEAVTSQRTCAQGLFMVLYISFDGSKHSGKLCEI